MGERQQQYAELDSEIDAGLGRIVVAINADETNRYVLGCSKIDSVLMNRVHAVKMPPKADVRVRDEEKSRSHNQLIRDLSGKFSFPRVVIDARLAQDGSDLLASVKAFRTEDRQFVLEMIEKQRVPQPVIEHYRDTLSKRSLTFLMHHMVDPIELAQTVEWTQEYYEPVAVVSSSKQHKEANSFYSLRHRQMTASMSRLALDSGITHLMASSNDAVFIREALHAHERYAELRITGTGSSIDLLHVGEHDVPSTIEATRGYVDYYVLGRAVLFEPDPSTRLLEYAAAIGSKEVARKVPS